MAVYAITVVQVESGEEYTFVQHSSSTAVSIRKDGEVVDFNQSVALPENLEIGKTFSYEMLGDVQRPMLVMSKVVGFATFKADPSKMDITQLAQLNLALI